MATPNLNLSVKGNSMRTKNLKKVSTMPRISAAQAMDLLETKLSEKYNSVKKAFITMDYDLDGKLSKDELRVSFDLMGLVSASAAAESQSHTARVRACVSIHAGHAAAACYACPPRVLYPAGLYLPFAVAYTSCRQSHRLQ